MRHDSGLVVSNPNWDAEVSEKCKELISLMVEQDPRVRLTVDQALEHPWFYFS